MIKKVVFNISLLIITIVILDFILGGILKHSYFKSQSGVFYRTTYAIEEVDSDILIFGSSRASRQYIPDIFENSMHMTCYNAGRDAMNIFYHNAILRAVLKRHKPEVIILDYHLLDLSEDGDNFKDVSFLLPYYPEHKEFEDIVTLKGPFEKWKYLSKIYPYNSLLIDLFCENSVKVSDYKGYIPYEGQWEYKIDPSAKSSPLRLNNKKVIYFNDFIDRAKKSGIDVYVVYSPLFQKLDLSEKADVCDSICKLYDVPTIDFSQETAFLNNKQRFKDNLHLNYEGAILFSSMVADTIQRLRKNNSVKQN